MRRAARWWRRAPSRCCSPCPPARSPRHRTRSTGTSCTRAAGQYRTILHAVKTSSMIVRFKWAKQKMAMFHHTIAAEYWANNVHLRNDVLYDNLANLKPTHSHVKWLNSLHVSYILSASTPGWQVDNSCNIWRNVSTLSIPDSPLQQIILF